jgi:nucleotide-binding universal stress UspA family protein
VSVRTILVGVDPSPGSRAALEWAAELAADLGARVVLVHAYEPLAHVGELAPGVDLRALREQARRELEGPLCEPLRARGLEHEARVQEGNPASVLVDAAEAVEADLVVVGARRQSRLKGLLLGSTSSRLAQLTPRPVVIIHAPGERAP